jgi:NAD(P)-dependent dehydrogenase (short-subunit alcohol dehydrogenase family)
LEFRPSKQNKIEETMKLITTPFGFKSTAEEVSEGISLSGKRAIITGAASGIGTETARVLAYLGAEVTLAARNTSEGERITHEIAHSTGNSKVSVAHLDIANPDSIHAFVGKWKGPLHILINNAGVMATPEARTSDGIELQFATNHLGHFALSLGLRDCLIQASKSRIVCVSSSAHLHSPIVWDDIHFSFRPYDPLLAYGQSKTAVNLFAVGATARWGKDGVTANALHPGAIKTNLQRFVGGNLKSPPEFHKTVQQGAATSVFLATSPMLDGIGGRYFYNCNEAEPVKCRPKDLAKAMGAVATYSLDLKNADRLWEESLRLISIRKSPK